MSNNKTRSFFELEFFSIEYQILFFCLTLLSEYASTKAISEVPKIGKKFRACTIFSWRCGSNYNIYIKSQTLHLNQPYFPFFNGKGSLRTSAASIMTSSTSTVSLNPVRITSEKTIHLRRNSNVHIQIPHDMVWSLLLMRKLRHSTTQELKELCCKTWISTSNNP